MSAAVSAVWPALDDLTGRLGVAASISSVNGHCSSGRATGIANTAALEVILRFHTGAMRVFPSLARMRLDAVASAVAPLALRNGSGAAGALAVLEAVIIASAAASKGGGGGADAARCAKILEALVGAGGCVLSIGSNHNGTCGGNDGDVAAAFFSLLRTALKACPSAFAQNMEGGGGGGTLFAALLLVRLALTNGDRCAARSAVAFTREVVAAFETRVATATANTLTLQTFDATHGSCSSLTNYSVRAALPLAVATALGPALTAVAPVLGAAVGEVLSGRVRGGGGDDTIAPQAIELYLILLRAPGADAASLAAAAAVEEVASIAASALFAAAPSAAILDNLRTSFATDSVPLDARTGILATTRAERLLIFAAVTRFSFGEKSSPPAPLRAKALLRDFAAICRRSEDRDSLLGHFM